MMEETLERQPPPTEDGSMERRAIYAFQPHMIVIAGSEVFEIRAVLLAGVKGTNAVVLSPLFGGPLMNSDYKTTNEALVPESILLAACHAQARCYLPIEVR